MGEPLKYDYNYQKEKETTSELIDEFVADLQDVFTDVSRAELIDQLNSSLQSHDVFIAVIDDMKQRGLIAS